MSENEQKDMDKIKEEFIRLSKSLIDPEAESENEFDLDIEFDERDVLKFEEEQDLNDVLEKSINEIVDSLTFIEKEE